MPQHDVRRHATDVEPATTVARARDDGGLLDAASRTMGTAQVQRRIARRALQRKEDEHATADHGKDKKKAGEPEIGANDQEMGQHMVDAMNTANGGGPYDLNHGIHYSYNYEYETRRAGKPGLWKEEYRSGHNASGHFRNPYELGRFMTWELLPGHSASEAIKAWLAGLTVAECNSAVVAMEIDTLRAAIGDKKFDRMFGSKDAKEDAAIKRERRLRIKPGTDGTPVHDYIKATALNEANSDAQAQGKQLTDDEKDKLVKPGEWYYFYNHPKYLLKHPGGAWQGENSLYMGKNAAGQRMWAGLGASNVTEDGMFEEMVSAYNADRDANDERVLNQRHVKNADGTFKDKKYDPKGGEFPDKITVDVIKKEPAYSIDGVSRTGGFLVDAGISLDAEAVKQTRDAK